MKTNNSNIALIQFASSSIHLAAGLEVLVNHNTNSNKYYFYWGSQTSYPSRMAKDLDSLSTRLPPTIEKTIKFFGITNNNNKAIYIEKNIKDKIRIFASSLKLIRTIEELRNIKLEGNDIGKYLVNELTFISKDSNFNVGKNHFKILKMAESYLKIYYSTINKIHELKLDLLYVYNGRFLHERAVIDAAINLRIDVLMFETMRDRILIRREGFHNRITNQRYMKEHWKNSNLTLQQKVQIGEKYFGELRGPQNPFNVKTETILKTSEKKYVSFFTSSDDEIVGLWDAPPARLGSQIECVEKLQEIFENQNEFDLIIRVHPNLKNKSKSQIKVWRNLIPRKNCKIVNYSEVISSYKILDNSDAVICFGSTLGLEAAYRCIPTLVLTDCGYDELNVVDKAQSWLQVETWVSNIHTKSKLELENRSVNSCIRGFYLETGGENFLNAKPINIGWGRWEVEFFGGNKISENKIINLYRLLINRIKFINLDFRCLLSRSNIMNYL